MPGLQIGQGGKKVFDVCLVGVLREIEMRHVHAEKRTQLSVVLSHAGRSVRRDENDEENGNRDFNNNNSSFDLGDFRVRG